MPHFEPIEHDPFEQRPVALLPVDHNPFDDLSAEVNAPQMPQFTPGSREWYANQVYGTGVPADVERQRAESAEFIGSMMPVLGESMALRDAWNASGRGGEALMSGDFGKAGSEYLGMLGDLGGALLPFSVNKLTRAAMPADPKNTTMMFAGPTEKTADISMDEASRMARAKQLGYADEPFYRGEATGKAYEGDAAFFSRDPEYASGFAAKGGQSAPSEYRLNLTRTFSDAAPLTASDYGRIVEAAAQRDPKLATDLAESIAPGKGVDWVIGFAKARPDFVVVEQGGAPFVRHAIERGSSDAVGLWRAAGYDALDSGRDVQKIGAEGIRSKNARFDPLKSSSTDIMAGLAGASLLPAWLVSQETTSRRD